MIPIKCLLLPRRNRRKTTSPGALANLGTTPQPRMLVGGRRMSQHFLRENAMLKQKILAVGAVVEGRNSRATTAVNKRDAGLAQQVAEVDDEIDEMEVE